MKYIYAYSSYIYPIFILVFCCTISHSVRAESMSGSTYTLQGSIGVMSGQGQAGVYTLNPSGDGIVLENSSGSTYTLSATPYSRPVSVTTSGGQTSVGSSLGATIFGSVDGVKFVPYALSGTTSSTGVDVYNPYIGKSAQNSTSSKTYRDYTYSEYTDSVNFGRKTLVSDRDITPTSVNWLLIKIICIGILLLFLKVWHQYRKNL